jgi:hypothetical protein
VNNTSSSFFLLVNWHSGHSNQKYLQILSKHCQISTVKQTLELEAGPSNQCYEKCIFCFPFFSEIKEYFRDDTLIST